MNVDKLGELAAKVADEHNHMTKAYDDESAAAAAVLEAVIAKVRPALRALGSRIGKSCREIAHGDVNKQRSIEEHFEQRGLFLAGDAGPVEDQPRDNSGRYEGAGLYLLTDGRLVVVSYEGTWSRWQGSTWGWQATMQECAAVEALDDWMLSECIEAIDIALRSQLSGRAKKNTKAAQERASKLRALAELIR